MQTTVIPTYAGSKLTVKRNTAKKTVEFTYTPAAATVKHNEIITVVTAEGTPDTITWSVDTKPTPEGLSDLTSKVKSTFQTSDSGTDLKTVLSDTTVKILDSTGAAIDYTSNPGGIARVNFIPSTVLSNYSVTKDSYYAVVTGVPTYMAATATTPAANPTTVTITSGGTAGTYTVKVDLYKASANVTTGSIVTSLGTALSSKEYKFTVVNSSDTEMKYTATLATGSELLYVNKDSRDETAFKVTKTDSQGRSTTCVASEYDVTVDSNLTVTENKTISGANDKIKAAGTAKARIWVDGEVIETIDVPYDVAAPTPQKQVQKLGSDEITITDFNAATTLSLDKYGVMALTAGGKNYTLYIVDQYGLPMANTAWAIAGKAFGDVTLSPASDTSYALTATSDKIPGSWTVTVTGGTTLACSGPANLTDLASLTASANNGHSINAIPYGSNDTITITGTTTTGASADASKFSVIKVMNKTTGDVAALTTNYTTTTNTITLVADHSGELSAGTYTISVISSEYASVKTVDFTIVPVTVTSAASTNNLTTALMTVADGTNHLFAANDDITFTQNTTKMPGVFTDDDIKTVTLYVGGTTGTTVNKTSVLSAASGTALKYVVSSGDEVAGQDSNANILSVDIELQGNYSGHIYLNSAASATTVLEAATMTLVP